MEDLFREILAPSPTSPTTSLPFGTGLSQCEIPISSETATSPAPEMSLDETLGALGEGVDMVNAAGVNWASGAELQRILDMLPNTTETEEYSTRPDLDFGWELDNFGTTAGVGMVGVF